MGDKWNAQNQRNRSLFSSLLAVHLLSVFYLFCPFGNSCIVQYIAIYFFQKRNGKDFSPFDYIPSLDLPLRCPVLLHVETGPVM